MEQAIAPAREPPMRVLIYLARPELRLAEPIVTSDGMPLLGRGTQLTRRHIQRLYQAGIRIIEVDHDPDLNPWETIPDVQAYLGALDARFAPVAKSRHMMRLKELVCDVYLDHLKKLEAR